MLTAIGISKKVKVSIIDGDALLIASDIDNALKLMFEDLETVEAIENNLSLIAQAMRAEQTIKEGIENGKE